MKSIKISAPTSGLKKRDLMFFNFITIHEAAKMLSLHPETLRRWNKSGQLKAHRVEGRHLYYNVEELEDLIASKKI